MELFEAIGNRVSIRAFKGNRIREGDLEKVLGAAVLAPSAGNLQPWVFVVTEGIGAKERLAEAALGQGFIAEAPVVITVCAVGAISADRYGSRGRDLYCLQDTAAAIENILLSATALGYGTCWVGAFNEGAVKEALGLPAGVRPVALIPIGFPGERPARVRRKPLGAVVRRETYCGENSRRKTPR